MATEEGPYWASAQWSAVLPPDNIIVQDVVIQRSFVKKASTDEASLKANNGATEENVSTKIPQSQQLDKLINRLDLLEKKYCAEDEKLKKIRSNVQDFLNLNDATKSISTSMPLQGGLFKGGLKNNISLLCEILKFSDMKSRGTILIASKEIHHIFSGPQIVISSRYRTNNAPPIEIQSKTLKQENHKITFLTSKESVKVISLKKNDEVFFRPCLLTAKYDADQDWPRGRILQIRDDGFIEISTWSWKLANGKGATIYARWHDVRRANERTRFQMLPEQRVWRAQELKEEATVLFTAALKDEKAHIDWLTMKKAKNHTKSSSNIPSSPNNTKTMKSPASSTKKKDKTLLKNSMFVLLNPILSSCEQAIDLVKTKLANQLPSFQAQITSQGIVKADMMEQHGMVDTHFSETFENAMNVLPKNLDLLPKQRELFETNFTMKWSDALKTNKIINLKQFINEIDIKNKNIKEEELNSEQIIKNSENIEKNSLWLGKGIHVLKVEFLNEIRFIINSHYFELKKQYLLKNAQIHYFIIEWPAEQEISWKLFEKEIFGTKLIEKSLRNELYQNLEKYNLLNLLNDYELGIYVSTSPLQSLFNKMNWLKSKNDDQTEGINDYSLINDSFAMNLLGGSLNKSKLFCWFKHQNQLYLFENELLTLEQHIETCNLNECHCKLKAIASNPYEKLEAAKQRYIEAVTYVDGDEIFDPDLDRRGQVTPCLHVLTCISELKVSMFTNIALCCRKLITCIDRMFMMEMLNKKLNHKKEIQKTTMLNNEMKGMKEVRALQCRQLIDYAMRASKIIDMLSLRGTHARPIVNELLKKHENAKFFGQMRCKALYLACTSYADTESPCIDNDIALEILKRAKTELNNHAPKKDKSDHVSPPLRKMLDAQKKEVDILIRKCSDARKKQQAAGKKRWSAAFEKNAKDPNAGLPPPKTTPTGVAEQAKLEAAFMNEGIKMPDGTTLGGADILGGGGLSNGTNQSNFISEMQSPPSPSQTTSTLSPSSSVMSKPRKQVTKEEDEEEDDESVSIEESILGAAALAGVAAAVGFGLMWFKNRRR